MKQAKKRTLTVKVTKKHIKNGQRSNVKSCPIALALIEQGFSDVSVNGLDLHFSERIVSPKIGIETSITYGANMSDRGSKFVTDFDDKKPVKPFTLVIRDIEVSDEDSPF